ETAGVGGLKIAETFPAGRDKSKVPRSGDFGGQSPLYAPCATENILQKKLTGSAIYSEAKRDKRLSQAIKLQTDNSW
ncbi:hypothetical protein, partial [Klebsiella aerogenes]|uniref:hypothetical protein n=1 Tax=Klebsiella aerogenes TaxID=548 RepID=UPI001D0D5044